MDIQSIGKKGEQYAQEYLINNGYTILATNQQFNLNKKKLGEIDIIARLGDVTYIFEIKTRSSIKFGNAVESLTAKKINTLYTITEFLSNKYSLIKLQLIAIQFTKTKLVSFTSLIVRPRLSFRPRSITTSEQAFWNSRIARFSIVLTNARTS